MPDFLDLLVHVLPVEAVGLIGEHAQAFQAGNLLEAQVRFRHRLLRIAIKLHAGLVFAPRRPRLEADLFRVRDDHVVVIVGEHRQGLGRARHHELQVLHHLPVKARRQELLQRELLQLAQ
jgi:hypothetical protein